VVLSQKVLVQAALVSRSSHGAEASHGAWIDCGESVRSRLADHTYRSVGRNDLIPVARNKRLALFSIPFDRS
jgi:hypothetical protein